MNKLQRKQALEKLIDKANTIEIHSSREPNFKSWKDLCERTLFKLFGENSKELEQFNKLKFFYNPSIWVSGVDYSSHHLECFNRDFETAIKMFGYLIDELEETTDNEEPEEKKDYTVNRLFISHAKNDKEIVGEIIDLLESMGLMPTQIFCSSIDGYGIPLGENFLDVLKREINNDVLVLFIFTHNFYKSQFCLCEMGASWVLAKEHIPIIVPPFTFDDIKGVVSNTQGIVINDELKLNLLHEKIVETFHLPQQPMSAGERKRDRVIERINKLITIN
jgi:hypothetical protein